MFIRRLTYKVFALFAVYAFIHAQPLLAEQDNQSGDVEIEDVQVKKRSPYNQSQEKAISWAEGVQAGKASALESSVLLHIAVSYLYCTVKAGPCSYILDTVIENDVISSRQSGAADCPTMKEFWKVWLHTDLEKRMKYMVPVGFLNSVSTFNQQQRPGYVKCQDKVAAGMKDPPGQRYSKDSSVSSSLQKTVSLLKDIKNKGINVLIATGVGKVEKAEQKEE